MGPVSWQHGADQRSSGAVRGGESSSVASKPHLRFLSHDGEIACGERL